MSEADPLLECVVNVSEGRNPETLEALSRAIAGTPGCYLLHRDVGPGAHRTVFTFAGKPAAVWEAAYRVYAVASERIDMRLHRGSHPRSGAVDVCPFVPVSGISMEEVAAGTQELAQRVTERFDLPIYLYAGSARVPDRFNLADVRRGEYEGLAEKLRSPGWEPDFGPSAPHPTLGVTIMGARPFLIAWNINLEPGASLLQARQLAARLRGSGTKQRPGLFPGLKAIGWFIDEYNRCQVSCNVVDPDSLSLARVYLTAVNLAQQLGTGVTGSELIGLIPARHLRAAANGFCIEASPEEEMETAVSVLGLNELRPFSWPDRVFETVFRAAAQTDRRNR
ncbi:glutamate formiminotransferase/formiminotetrahydrofolate cyclodeaminase [Neolewinella xylanilytica]|uniref:glutamate formimidoyltransferase n=1 Tax=Neolewinella xylanilytica TaxID=1514080 RepID=A0A2S6I273_9BACT|nr:glutamate formimidoyltransferase [Neolewinella xylanilytica]PPK85282.1 glutamate formiminotransferase/formiminotetrahydrofolate cyclodeaminase [Neolewinella xylanilytica]